ncbi:MAG: hypothetical protein QW453_06780 [Thermoprotei archaeon]
MVWQPDSWLLAQDCHFGYGLAITFGVRAFHAPLYWIGILLVLELVFKEGLFDQFVEGNKLVWGGLIDWSFYIFGSLAGLIILAVFG